MFPLEPDKRLNLLEWLGQQTSTVIDVPAKIGRKPLLHGRLVAIGVPAEVAELRRHRLRENAKKKGKDVSVDRLALCAWTLLLSNIPLALTSAEELVVLARCRWHADAQEQERSAQLAVAPRERPRRSSSATRNHEPPSVPRCDSLWSANVLA